MKCRLTYVYLYIFHALRCSGVENVNTNCTKHWLESFVYIYPTWQFQIHKKKLLGSPKKWQSWTPQIHNLLITTFFFWSFINTYFDLLFIFQISTRQWLSVYSSEPIHKHGLSDSSGIKQQWDWWHSRWCLWWLYITILLVSYAIYNATES